MKKLLILSILVTGLNFVSNATTTCTSKDKSVTVSCSCSEESCVKKANAAAALIK